MKYIAVDIETSGLSPIKDKIIEIGASLYVDGEVQKTFSSLVKPQLASLPERITELTGITEEMLADAPSEAEVMQEFLAFAEEGIPLLGHNILFDYSFLKVAAGRLGREFARNGFDTLRLARLCHPELPSKTLAAMCEFYHIENEHAHRAYEDAIAAAELFEKLKSGFSEKYKAEFEPEVLIYKEKKQEPITLKQVRFLKAIIEYHHLELAPDYETMTKSEASRLVDTLLAKHGRIPYVR